MSLIDKIVRTAFSVAIIFSIFTFSVFSQSKLIVENENSQVNELSDYYLNFQTTIGDYFRLFYGELVVTLPKGFSTDELDSVDVFDEFKHFSYIVKKIEKDENSVHLYLKLKITTSLSNIESEYPSDSNYPINLRVKMSQIQNPPQAGDYQISLEGLSYTEKTVIGPLISDPFTITENTSQTIHSIIVSPADNIDLKAGDEQTFSASAYDQHGNKIEGIVFQWSLFECTNCIGQFIDSSLTVTRVGEGIAQATADGVRGFSGAITVTPGDLSRMTLQIDETQFVGNVINHNAAVILYDAHNNLKTDYDLSGNPIELVLSSGELNKYILDNNAFLVGGVVRLKDFELIYSGLSGQVDIYADNGMVSSNIELVYFNNHDIIDAQNLNGETISSVFAGQPVAVNVLMRNNGNLKLGTLHLTYRWKSDTSLVRTISMISPNPGELRVQKIGLPALNSVGAIDELIVSTYTEYLQDSITTVDEKRFTVEVLDVAQLSIVPESFKPDTMIHQIPFDISFEVQSGGFTKVIDSTKLNIVIVDKLTQQTIAELFNGNPEHLSFIDGVISYGSISAMLNSNVLHDNGWYDVVMDYQLSSSGNMLTLSEPLVDSMFIFFDNGITLVEGSLTPKVVYAGTNVSFEFKVNIESDMPYVFHGLKSQFKIFDNSFSSSTNLFIDRDSLFPGENVLRSASISIQPEQIGSDLFAEAKFDFCLPGMYDTLTFITTFTEASVPIKVIELPLVQILDLEVIAPNAPIVNSSQEIQFKATVANLSGNVLDSLQLELKSIDGSSTIKDTMATALDVQPFDTVTIFFDVTAAPVAQNLPESFRVDIYENSVGMTVPINNSAFLIIEQEASIDISYRVNGIESTDGFVVNQGEHIHVLFDVDNNGTAQVANGTYQFIVSGLNANEPDTFNGLLFVDSSIEFDFDAPLFDTVIDFEFLVIDDLIDINYNLPAKIINETIEFSILSVSNDAEIIVEPTLLGTNLVLPGRSKELFELTFTNNSNSSLNSIQIDFIDLNIFSSNLDSIDVRDVISVGNTYFSEDGEKISTTTAGGNELMFWLTDIVVVPQQSRTIKLVIEFKETSYKELVLELPQAGIKATYIEGPNSGQDVIVKSVSGKDNILSYQIVLKGNSLDESFVIENNPFDPTVSPVQFAFELVEAAPIEFQMFTLTGEEVYRYLYPAGTNGASIGENIIRWDGHNNSGEMVLNGVYIASIINKLTGEYARIKVAVVK